MKSALFQLSIAVLLLSGCSTPFGEVRRDFRDRYADDIPAEGGTTGGRFTEGNWIRETEAPMGHLENPSVPLNSQKDRFREGERELASDGSEKSGVALASAGDFYGNPSSALAQKMKKRRATKNDFIDDSKGDGSLWTSDGQTNYFLTKNKVKTTGDLLTVTSDEDLVKMVALELKRTMTPNEKSFEMEFAEAQAERAALAKEQAASRTPASNAEDKEKNKEEEAKREAIAWENIDLSKYVEMKAGDPIMAEVVDRYPNGNYKIRGVKKVRFRNSLRYFSFIGIAKHTDITDDDAVAAGKLYEYRLEALR